VQTVTAASGGSAEALASLASTRPGSATARLLHAALHSKRLLLLKSLLTRLEREAVPPAARRRLQLDWRLLERAEHRDPTAVRQALAYPSVGNWLVRALSIPPGEVEEFAEFVRGFGALAAAAALHTGLSFRTTLPVRDGLLALPGSGVYATRAEAVRVVAGPRSLRLTPDRRRTGTVLRPPYGRACAAGWTGIRPLPGSAVLWDDADPFREPGPEPLERGGTAGAYGAWTGRWRAALALLDGADPARRAEVTSLVRCIVPRPPGAIASATLSAAPWGVLAALPESGGGLASVLVHEVHHSKLATFCDLVPLYVPGGPAVHRVPWRPDPRPLGAVLQGTYAHLALADLWSRMAQRPGATLPARAEARRRAEDYREQVGNALTALRGSGELTWRGEEFTRRMAEHQASLAAAPTTAPAVRRTGRKRPGSWRGDIK
jgi:HEXXH motif-containing protein